MKLSHIGQSIRDGTLEYDHYIVAGSGGKDSIACLLQLLKMGIPRDRIEWWHHLIDGREGGTYKPDWPHCEAYNLALTKALGVKCYFSWRQRGFEGEMLRQDARTAPTSFETPDGLMQKGGTGGNLSTRRKFPQTSADLKVRWCSSSLKIDVGRIALNNQKRFEGKRTLFISGERAEESPNRAKYPEFAKHDCDRLKRHVDHWRAVHQYTKADVWGLMEEFSINPAPPYRLGFGRYSCALCIFDSDDQWATLNLLMPEMVGVAIAYERGFGLTIHRTLSLPERIKRGTPYEMDPADMKAAISTTWDEPIILPPGGWKLPKGAYGEDTGPS